MTNQNTKTFFSILFLVVSYSVYSQTDVNQEVASIKNKIKKITEKDSLQLSGSIFVNGLYNFVNRNGPSTFDYAIGGRAILQYKGIKLPLQYSLTNGRTLSRISGPSFKTPNFSALGISPTKGNFTFHFGHRNMDFSKFTFNGQRFKGIGMEYNGDNLTTKSFKGEITFLSLTDLNLLSERTNAITRNAWGHLTKYKFGVLTLGSIIFKSHDEIKEPKQETILKENTSIEVNSILEIGTNFKIIALRALSAYTPDASDERVEIPTHSTLYNMLGLFEKKTSSRYNYASKVELQYSLNKYNLSLNYESVDRGYQTLGSLFYDNNYHQIDASFSGQLSKRIQLNNTFGLRKNKVSNNQIDNNYQVVVNSNINFKASNDLNLAFNFSNLRNTQKVFQQRPMSTVVDSIFLAQVSTSYGMNANLLLNKDKQSSLNLVLRYQDGKGIQQDSVSKDNNIRNFISSLNYGVVIDKHTLNSTISFLSNSTLLFSSKTFSISAGDSWRMNDKNNLDISLNLNWLITDFSNAYQILLNLDYGYKINPQFTVTANSKLEMNKNQESFGLNIFSVGVDLDYTFGR
jgi:hypothetical protein